METGPWLENSSDRPVKPGIEPGTPGLQGKWLIYYTTKASDPDRAALIRAASSLSNVFALANKIKYEHTQMDLTSNFFLLTSIEQIYITIHSGRALA